MVPIQKKLHDNICTNWCSELQWAASSRYGGDNRIDEIHNTDKHGRSSVNLRSHGKHKCRWTLSNIKPHLGLCVRSYLVLSRRLLRAKLIAVSLNSRLVLQVSLSQRCPTLWNPDDLAIPCCKCGHSCTSLHGTTNYYVWQLKQKSYINSNYGIFLDIRTVKEMYKPFAIEFGLCNSEPQMRSTVGFKWLILSKSELEIWASVQEYVCFRLYVHSLCSKLICPLFQDCRLESRWQDRHGKSHIYFHLQAPLKQSVVFPKSTMMCSTTAYRAIDVEWRLVTSCSFHWSCKLS